MIEYRTSVDFCLDSLSGKWKVLILSQLSDGAKRISQILSEIPGLTKRVLIRSLRELEDDFIVQRNEFAENTPRVEYSLTKHGKKLEPIIDAMHHWGLAHIKKLDKKKIEVFTAKSFDDLKDKITNGNTEIEKIKELTNHNLKNIKNELIKSSKRLDFEDL